MFPSSSSRWSSRSSCSARAAACGAHHISAPTPFARPAQQHDLVARASEALTHGYTLAFAAAACMFLADMVVVLPAVNAGRPEHTDDAVPYTSRPAHGRHG
ncbi:hypothetical protein [Streptomyces sp. NPDC088812]|uniref:hypothetical protein n=1 Tax=Streptomyces sp. NPDC088812 TaxID=3365905 RepID=UPI003828446F